MAAELGNDADDTEDADDEDEEVPWLGPEWCDPEVSPLTLDAGEKPSLSLAVMLPRWTPLMTGELLLSGRALIIRR